MVNHWGKSQCQRLTVELEVLYLPGMIILHLDDLRLCENKESFTFIVLTRYLLLLGDNDVLILLILAGSILNLH